MRVAQPLGKEGLAFIRCLTAGACPASKLSYFLPPDKEMSASLYEHALSKFANQQQHVHSSRVSNNPLSNTCLHRLVRAATAF